MSLLAKFLHLMPLGLKKRMNKSVTGNKLAWMIYCRLRYGLKSKAEGSGIYRYSGGGMVLLAHQTNVDIYGEVVKEHIYNKVLPLKLKSGDVVIDVGAHIGVFSILAGRMVGDKGLIIAIEPEPGNATLLLENLKLNSVDNVKVVKKAVWSETGKAELHVEPEGSGHSLKRVVSEQKIMVDLDTIDNILAEVGVGKVDFIKIDVEGAELEALRGASKSLEQNGTKLAIAAYHTRSQADELSSYLKELNMKVFFWQDTDGRQYVGACRGLEAGKERFE